MASALGDSAPNKRKRAEAGDQLDNPNLTKPIVLKAFGDEHALDAPRVELRQKLLIPRQSLPLTFNKRDHEHQSCFFSAWIPALEELGTHEGPDARVLIAISTIDGCTLAVERLRAGVYSLCPLHDWINLEELGSRPSKRPKITTVESNGSFASDAPWWDRSAVSTLAATKATAASRPLPTLSLKSTHETSSPVAADIFEPPMAKTATLPAPDEDQAATPEAILAALQAKYLQALYISRTSLAYFAKGPLARARNLLTRTDGTLPARDSSEVLQDMLLTVAMNDKKYSATIPDFLKELPTSALDSDANALKQRASLCKKGKRRKKLGNGGLFPNEEEHVLQWWLEREGISEPSSVYDTFAQRLRTGLAKLRTRETQLQIMLILEAMIAETSNADVVKPSIEVEANGKSQMKAGIKTHKKPKSLQSLLDMHIDRLCIWQTTQNGFDIDNTAPRPKSSHGDKVDALQDFCTEALVPFFASRLPKVFAQICKKMGTVGASSPVRPTLRKVASASQAHPKPGAALSRAGLQRVATDGSLGTRRTPGLTRSATETAAARFKREVSEINLDEIPVHEPRATPIDRMSRREVDIDALTKKTEAKLKRRALLEQEIQGAINVLRKPNPRMAVKEFVDSSDGRTVQKFKRKREPVPTASVPVPGHQVQATPRKDRTRNVYSQAGEASNLRNATVPPSSDPRIPSSSHRPSVPIIRKDGFGSVANADGRFHVQSTPLKRSQAGIISRTSFGYDVTPTKKRARMDERLDPSLLVEDEPEVLVNTLLPEAARKIRSTFTVAQTPTKPTSKHLMPQTRPMEMIAATPVKGAVKEWVATGSTEESTKPAATSLESALVQSNTDDPAEKEVDVYKTLGWDDEDDMF